ncbi:MAG: hypothetical protein M3270_08905 [Thermoproteota archaeon]|nr:hypothetical protein [Thermoproteota archaeon]
MNETYLAQISFVCLDVFGAESYHRYLRFILIPFTSSLLKDSPTEKHTIESKATSGSKV